MQKKPPLQCLKQGSRTRCVKFFCSFNRTPQARASSQPTPKSACLRRAVKQLGLRWNLARVLANNKLTRMIRFELALLDTEGTDFTVKVEF
jgi:hypothetical protein